MQVTEDEQKLAKHHMIDILDSTAVNSVVDFREVIAIIYFFHPSFISPFTFREHVVKKRKACICKNKYVSDVA